jgi:hypothetical protein
MNFYSEFYEKSNGLIADIGSQQDEHGLHIGHILLRTNHIQIKTSTFLFTINLHFEYFMLTIQRVIKIYDWKHASLLNSLN